MKFSYALDQYFLLNIQPLCGCNVPRIKGDTENPRGGVRGVIKDKQSY